MALRAVPDHPKFADFKRRLGLTKGAALGYLECIWHFTGRFTPAGNIGKYQDSAIEAWVEWDGEPGALVEALIQSDWAHRHENPEYRVVIHDWSMYADEIVNTVLARHCECFWDGVLPRSGKLNQAEREKFRRWIEENNLQVRPSHRPAGSQPEVSHKAALSPKPAPAPAPALKEKNTNAAANGECTGVNGKPNGAHSTSQLSYLSDESFNPFVLAACTLWPDIIPEDLQLSWQFTWRKWDFHKKRLCVANTNAQIEAGVAGKFVTRPPKYLESGAWKRPPRVDQPSTSTAPPKPDKCPVCSLKPCVCYERHLAKEREKRATN